MLGNFSMRLIVDNFENIKKLRHLNLGKFRKNKNSYIFSWKWDD